MNIVIICCIDRCLQDSDIDKPFFHFFQQSICRSCKKVKGYIRILPLKSSDKLCQCLCSIVLTCAEGNASAEVLLLVLDVERSFFYHV